MEKTARSKFLDLKSWQEYQQRFRDQREAQAIYEKTYAEIQKAKSLQDQKREALPSGRLQPSGMEGS